MSKSLPDRPNLDHVKNEAKALLKANRAGDAGGCAPLREVPRLRNASDAVILAAQLTLQEVQHAVAVGYGFQGWKELKDRIAQQSDLAGRVGEAIEVFTSKGPDHDSTRSSWEHGRQAQINKLLAAGDDGFRVMTELARSDNGRLRNAAAIFFVQSDDKRVTDELRALLDDPAATVRSRAVRFYASRIHPSCGRGNAWGISEPADAVPDGVEAILPLVRDASAKVQMDAVAALSAYARLGDSRIMDALREALHVPQHKVQHAAAHALDVPCPGCDDVRKEIPGSGI